MKKEKKGVLFCALIGIFFLILIWGSFFVIQPKLEVKNLIEDDFSFIFQVESSEVIEKKLLLRGFAFMLGRDAVKGNMEVFLYNSEKNKLIYPKITYNQRDDVNEYFKCGYDYSKSGFIASFNTIGLDLEKYCLEIIVKYKWGKIYKTGIFLVDGKVVYTDPREFAVLNVEGTDIENIVNNGLLRVYRPDVGMYVYQYDGKLFWIADSKYYFEDDGSTGVQYQMNTTQVEKLPEYRRKNNWLWSNLEFTFEKNEIKEINTGKYRVSVCALPDEYSVTVIWTGYYADDNWVWLQYFRPWIEL